MVPTLASLLAPNYRPLSLASTLSSSPKFRLSHRRQQNAHSQARIVIGKCDTAFMIRNDGLHQGKSQTVPFALSTTGLSSIKSPKNMRAIALGNASTIVAYQHP